MHAVLDSEMRVAAHINLPPRLCLLALLPVAELQRSTAHISGFLIACLFESGLRVLGRLPLPHVPSQLPFLSPQSSKWSTVDDNGRLVHACL